MSYSKYIYDLWAGLKHQNNANIDKGKLVCERVVQQDHRIVNKFVAFYIFPENVYGALVKHNIPANRYSKLY